MELNSAPARPSLLGSSTPAKLLFVAALAVAFTLFALRYSERFGRLAGDIVPDDSGYFVDGARWLGKFNEDGTKGLWQSFLATRPHSPWSTALAFVSFLLFGLKDWAPYAANSVLVALTLWFALRLVRATPWYLQLGALVFTLTAPFLLTAVHEFRPDYAAAFFTAAGTMALLVGGLENNRRASLQGGVLFGLALLAKPSISPLTFAMLGAAGATALLLASDGRWRGLWSRDARGLIGAALWPVLIVAGPYYGLHHAGIIHYIRETVFAKSGEVWRTQMSLPDSLRYYLTGSGGSAMLGKHVFAIGALGGIALALVAWRGDRRQRLFFCALLALLSISFIIPVLTKNKSVFFGLSFQVLAFFVAIAAIAAAARLPWPRPSLVGAPMALALAGSVCFFPARPATLAVDEGALATRDGRRMNQDIVAALTGEDCGNRKEQTLFTDTTGYVNGATLQWLLLRDGFHFKVDGVQTLEMADYRKRMSRDDYLLLNDVGAYGQATGLPSWKLAGELVTLVKDRPDFQLLREFPSLNGHSYYLFRNLRPRKLPPFWGWTHAENLEVDGDERIVFQPKMSVLFSRRGDFPLELRAAFQSETGQQCRVVLNGELVSTQTSGPRETKEFTVTLPAKIGENRLDFEWNPERLRAEGRDLPVAFHKLQLADDFTTLPALSVDK